LQIVRNGFAMAAEEYKDQNKSIARFARGGHVIVATNISTSQRKTMIQSARSVYALTVADYNMDRGMSISATGAPVVIRQSKGQKPSIAAMDGHASVVT